MNLRSFLCITLLWLCHPQPEVWAWQIGHPESSAAPAQEPLSSATTGGDSASVPAVPDASNLPLPQPVASSSRSMVPVQITANRQRKDGSIYSLLGDVEIKYGTYVLHADNVSYNEDTGAVRAEGDLDVEGRQDDKRILADHATLNLNLDTGRFYNVTGSVGVRGN